MHKINWGAFLSEYNSELLSYKEVVEKLPPELIKSGWLGFAGASEEELLAVENRLATHLPPSFRAFLKVSNGWRFPSVSIFDLLPVAEVAWFANRNQDWIDAYIGPWEGMPPVSDEDYFQYGKNQDCCKLRVVYLQTALQVSDQGDSAVVLLNPKVVSSEGEWETWFFANWLPGAVRYRSFGDWFVAERAECRSRLTPLPMAQNSATAKKPRSVKKAQSAARNGQTALAVESLESFAAKGDDCAAASLAEIYAFMGRWEKVITNAGRLIANPEAAYAGNVFHDMINLLGRAGHRSGEWRQVVQVVEAAIKSNGSRDYDVHHEHFRENQDKLLRNLSAYAQRQGKPPHELLAIFGGPNPDPLARMSDTERQAWYQNAVKMADSNPQLNGKPQAKTEHCFSLAKGIMEDDALELYEAYGKTFVMGFEAGVYVASVQVRRGNPDAAWAAIESNLSKWWPVALTQVAPVCLLIDENLHTLMTPERCQIVLSTPRGPEGEKSGGRGG